MKNAGVMVLAALLFTTMIPSQVSADTTGINGKSSGYFMADAGYLNEHEDVTLRKWTGEYFNALTGGLRFTAEPSDHFDFVINPELRSHNIFPIRPGVKTGELVQRTKYEIYLEEAKGRWTFGEKTNPHLQVNFGYMTYVDNPDAKVLGNYLFRSMIYPSMLFTKMDNPAAYLFGLLGRADFLGGNLKNNFFFLSEVQRYPFFDLSLAYSGSFKVGEFLELGIGLNYKSLIPVRPSRTTPRGVPSEGSGLVENTFKFAPFQDSTVIMRNGKAYKTIWISEHTHPDSAIVRVRDSAGNEPPALVVKRTGNGISGMSGGTLNNLGMTDLTVVEGGAGDLYPELHGTNTHFSFAGLIIGGRVAFNLMGFMGDVNPLGKDALRIYAEGAVLGWKNYPGYYEKREERVPLMLGINLPTFNLLDFLSFEVQRFKSQDLPTFDRRAQLNVPQPGTHKGEQEAEWDMERRKKDDVKWILTAKRSFSGWGVSLQSGTDNMKLLDDGGNDFYDASTRPSHWYTQFRFFLGIR